LNDRINSRKEIVMKKIILIGSTLIVLGLFATWAIPALAHGSTGGATTSTNNEAWEDMYQACQNGDWEAMGEAARDFHGEGYDMPYHEDYNGMTDEDGETSGESWDEMGSHTGGGMMGGGMMGW